jgi:hypothetical protein
VPGSGTGVKVAVGTMGTGVSVAAGRMGVWSGARLLSGEDAAGERGVGVGTGRLVKLPQASVGIPQSKAAANSKRSRNPLLILSTGGDTSFLFISGNYT